MRALPSRHGMLLFFCSMMAAVDGFTTRRGSPTPPLATHWVSPTGSDSGNCTSEASPCKTLAYTINTVSDGAVISAMSGIYREHDVSFLGKEITLMGHSSAILDCQQQGRGFFFTKAGDSNAALEGFTIRNCSTPAANLDNPTWEGNGGGIAIYDAAVNLSYVTIEHCSSSSLQVGTNFI